MKLNQRFLNIFSSIKFFLMWVLLSNIIMTILYRLVSVIIYINKGNIFHKYLFIDPLYLKLFELWLIISLLVFGVLFIIHFAIKRKINFKVFILLIDLGLNHAYFELLYNDSRYKFDMILYYSTVLTLIVSQLLSLYLSNAVLRTADTPIE